MSLRPLVTVRGFALPTPSTYNSNTATLVDAARNLQGVTVGDVIRDDVAKIEMTWRFLTPTQWTDILRLFDDKQGGSFYNPVNFFDQTINDWATRTMYISDRNAGMFKYESVRGVRGYTGSRIALIEV